MKTEIEFIIYSPYSEIRGIFRDIWNGMDDWQEVIKQQELKALKVMDSLKISVQETKKLGTDKINNIYKNLYNL